LVSEVPGGGTPGYGPAALRAGKQIAGLRERRDVTSSFPFRKFSRCGFDIAEDGTLVTVDIELLIEVMPHPAPTELLNL
jgi:hypothetical protein